MSKKHVAVLKGGMSKEREVSLSSGKGVAKALSELGYEVTEIDAGKDVAIRLAGIKPDVVFNALHGTYGEDGCIQGLLEIMGIPYTHSGVLASAIAMDKPYAKKIFRDAGLPVAPGKVMAVDEIAKITRQNKLIMAKPFVMKPTNNGSSVGVIIVRENEKFVFNEKQWQFGENILVEKYIPGMEISVAVLDGKALGAIEISPNVGFYDYKAKYTVGKAEHIMPARLSSKGYKEALRLAEKAHAVLGCRGVSRTDMRVKISSKEEEFYILEVNTHPGMTRLSLTPEIANHAGISYKQLVDHLVKTAALDNKACSGKK